MAKTKLPKLPKSFIKAVENIKSKDFTHFKVELEASLDRDTGHGDRCEDCTEGWVNCEDCNGDGWIEETCYNDGGDTMYDRNNCIVTAEVECQECNGEGQTECGDCYGRGYIASRFTNDYCQDYILQKISRETFNAINYSQFYHDGSVDSEFTFTMPIEKAHLAIDVMERFNDLARLIGNGVNTSNAGMHLSLLPCATYPCPSGQLNEQYMANYRKQVTKLLPGLYFAASHNSSTRGLSYRIPRVSNDEKYSAIYTHGDTCLEFRLFDTCYDRPEALLEKVEVMAQTLKYYSTDIVKVNYKEFKFPTSVKSLSEMYQRAEDLDALDETLKEVKTTRKSIKSLKSERSFKLNKRTLVAKMRQIMREIQPEYERYVKSETFSRRENVYNLIKYNQVDIFPQALTKNIESHYDQLIEIALEHDLLSPILSLDEYITHRKYPSNRTYTLTLETA